MGDVGTPPARRRHRAWIGFVLAALLALAGWYFWPKPGGVADRPGFRGSGAETPVSVVSVQAGQIDRSLRALGTVTAARTITIRSRVDGPLQSLHFHDGQAVQAGDLLAVIDPRPFQIALEQARGQQAQHAAQLANAKLDLARYQRLIRQDSVARQQFDAARAQVAELEGQAMVDKAAVDDAQLQLSYTQIRAPVAGHLGLHKVDVGNMIHASDADGLVVLTQDQPIDVLFAIAQGHLPALLAARRTQAELPVQVRLAVDGPVLAQGVLRAVDNQISVETGTVQLKARFANEDAVLFPNQFVQVQLRLGLEKGLVIPLRAVQQGSAGQYVYRVDDQHKVHVVPVTTGVDDGEQVVIESGLQDGETIVLDGTDRLRDGTSVRVVPAQQAAEAPDRMVPGTMRDASP